MMHDLLGSMKLLNEDHTHDGWPAVRMSEINGLIEIIESQSKQLSKVNKRISELEKYNIALANESHNKSMAIDRANERAAELEKDSKDAFVKFAKEHNKVDGRTALFIHALGVAFDKEQLRKEQSND